MNPDALFGLQKKLDLMTAERDALAAELKVAQDANRDYLQHKHRGDIERAAYYNHCQVLERQVFDWQQSGTKMLDEIMNLREDMEKLLYFSDMRRAWDTLTEEEFNEIYCDEHGPMAFGDVDELWVRAKDTARAALKKVQP